MRKSVISYHIGGYEKLIKALGKIKGDPYDAAVKRINKLKRVEREERATKKKGSKK